MNALPTPRENIARLEPYPLDSAASGDNPDTVNLQYNEHWEPLADAVRAACIETLASCNLYPETSAAPLRSALAAHHDIDRDQIVCANGSSELISLLCEVYCRDGDEVVVGPYSYMYFRTASLIAGATPVKAVSQGIKLSIGHLINAVTPRTRIVFVDNPQNPLGDYFSESQVRDLRDRLPEQVLLVIDAAYAEYVESEDYDAGISLVDAYPNTVMLRTFSKIHGLAGLRIGWAYAAPDVISLLHRVRQPNNLTSVSVAAAVASMAETEAAARRYRNNRDWRRSLTATLTDRFQFSVQPSQANFVLAALPEWYNGNATQLASTLAEHNVLIRPMASYGLPGYVRITVGPEPSTKRLFAALALTQVNRSAPNQINQPTVAI